MITPKIINWLVAGFFLVVIGIVFQQIFTSMTEQGIASGGPYDNAAAYPMAVAIIIGALLVIQFLIDFFSKPSTGQINTPVDSVGNTSDGSPTITTGIPADENSSENATESEGVTFHSLRRPATMLAIFTVYLASLNSLGYHLTTTPMIIAILWLSGIRGIVKLLLAALAMSFVFAFIFENFLNIVLPGGIYRLNIPW